MPDPTCVQCGHALPEDGRFCSRCGAVFVRPVASSPSPAEVPAPATAVAPPVPAGKAARENVSATWIDVNRPVHPPTKASQATMFGFAPPKAGAASSPSDRAPASVPVPSRPAPLAVPAAEAAATVFDLAPTPRPITSHKQTMIGVTSPMSAGPAGTPSEAVTAAAAPAQATSPKALLPSAKGTMIGVAIPGIAPAQASAPPAEGTSRRAGSNTMLGVAIPGVAPVQASTDRRPGSGTLPLRATPAPKAPPRIFPMPAPLVDDEPAVGPAPRLERRGVPLTYVAGGVLALVLVFGVAVALLWKGQSLVVLPRLDAQGHEELHLTCEGCPDGTTAELEAAHATFQSREADLAMTTPLSVGDNPLTIRLTRPRMGRNEDVKVVVPIAFRIRADLAGLTDVKPAVVVRVEAIAGTSVKVDGKPLALDAQGKASYPIDVSAQTIGGSDDLRLIDQSVSYSITPPAPSPGNPAPEQHGTLAFRAGIAPLHLDAPGPARVIESSSFKLAGRTVKGGTVTVNGQPVAVEPDGSFSRSLDAPAIGDTSVEIRASGPALATRTTRFTVKRVSRLADEARARERAPWLDFEAMVAAGDRAVGKATVVEGSVVEARSTSNQVVALVEDARGCGKSDVGPCLVRVVSPGDEALTPGARVKVYGEVTGTFRPASPADGADAKKAGVPVVQADFVVKAR